MTSKGSAEYQAAVRVVNDANRTRRAAGMKAWTAKEKTFAVAFYLTGYRAAKLKLRKGDDDGEED